MTVSIIIPVYNVEKYLKDCLNSVINQTYKNLEIICVNDGSKDNSLSILEEYAQKDNRIKIINQENQGLSAARNTGLNNITGDYATFLDSDDWISLDYIEKLHSAITRNDCDIAVATIIRKREHSQKYRVHYTEEKIYTSFEEKIKACNIPTCCYVWNKLYKKELIKNNYFTVGRYFEDVLWIPEIIKKSNKLVTVPDIAHYYRVNSTSIVKTPSKKKQDDSYFAKKYITEYLAKNNVTLSKKQKTLTREIKYFFNIPLIKTKVFENTETKYLFSFMPISKKINNNTILVFNTACFGDILVCNSLCQNIKQEYPDSKLVFVTNKNFLDVAKHQKGVDEVVAYDKNSEHKGLKGIFKFVKSFPYKNPKVSFITYKNQRNYLIAKLLGSKKILTPIKLDNNLMTQEKHNKLFEKYAKKESVNFPIRFNIPEEKTINIKEKYNLPNKYIALCSISKNPPKDMPIETAIELIEKVNSQNVFKIAIVGNGKKTLDYVNEISKKTTNFINLVDKTSIIELAQVLKESSGLISVDTGTMHLGCALDIPTAAVFYEKCTLSNWAPRPELYKSVLIKENQTAENMLDNLREII